MRVNKIKVSLKLAYFSGDEKREKTAISTAEVFI